MPSYLEIAGFVTGILGVYLTILRSPFCWPISALNVVIYGFIFLEAKLYADMGLQGVFFAFSIYGWYAWTKGAKDYSPDASPLKVNKSTKSELLSGLFIMLPAAFILGTMLRSQTDADIPYLDSLLASLSIFAQILQTRKKIENWYFWILVDAAYVFIYVSKDLYLSAMLYALFLALAMHGYHEWKKVLALSSKHFSQ